MIGYLGVACALAPLIWFLTTPFRTGLWRVPGPWWRRYSDIFQVHDAYKRRTSQQIRRCHEQYGPVVVLGPTTISFADWSMIDHVYANRNPFPKGVHWVPLQTVTGGVHYPSVIASLDTQTHATLKRPVAGIYSMSNVTKSESYINDSIIKFVKKLDNEYNGEIENAMSVFEWCHYFAYDTIMKLTVSDDFGLIDGDADREDMFRGVDAAQTYRAMAACMPWLHKLVSGSPLVRVFEKRMGSFPRRARELIKNRRVNGAPQTGEREDLLSQIMATREKHPDIVDDIVMHGYVTTPLLAGSDTVTIACTTIIYMLGKNLDVQEKLHNELRNSGLPLPPPYVAVQKLPYLDAVVREAFRIHPIGAMLSRRTIPSGMELPLAGGIVLPSGTAVAISGWATHFDKSVYGDDVFVFRPERWLQDTIETEEDFAERLRKMNKADLTWGHGDRACLGKNIAKCEIYKLMATLYTIFDIQLRDPRKEWKIKETVLAKQEGVEAVLKYRPDMNVDQLNL